MMHGYDGGVGSWLAMGLMMVVFWGLVVVAVVALVRSFRTTPESSSAHALLAERLARGEVTEEEYVARREVLSRP